MLGTDSRDVVLELPAHPSVVGSARDAATGLARWLPPETLHTLELVVSELVTNAIRHAGTEGGTVQVRISLRDDSVLAEVRDAGPGFDAPEHPSPHGISSGFGLFLVDRLAERWGVSAGGPTRVWAELRR